MFWVRGIIVLLGCCLPFAVTRFQPFKQGFELEFVQRNHVVLDARPLEAHSFDPLVRHHETGSILDDQFQLVSPFRAEVKDGTAERVELKFI